MKLKLNKRLIPSHLITRIEQLAEEQIAGNERPLFTYDEDPANQAVLHLQPESKDFSRSNDFSELHRSLERKIIDILEKHGALNPRKLTEPDGRVWVTSPLSPTQIDGLDVRYKFTGHPPISQPSSFHGTLNCTHKNEHGEISVRVVSEMPIEDEDGREVYHADLDQPSIDSLVRDDVEGWQLYLPDRFRAGR